MQRGLHGGHHSWRICGGRGCRWWGELARGRRALQWHVPRSAHAAVVGGSNVRPLCTVGREQVAASAGGVRACMVRGEHCGSRRRCGSRGCRSWSRSCSRRHRGGRIRDLAKKGVARDRKVAPSTHAGPSAGPDGGAYLREQVTTVVGGVANMIGGKLRRNVGRLGRRNQRCRLWCGHV